MKRKTAAYGPMKKIFYTFIAIILIGGAVFLFSRFIRSDIKPPEDPRTEYNLGSDPVTEVSGNAWNYSLSFPPGSWFVGDLKKLVLDSPDADLWVVNPEKDAHVIAFGAEVDKSIITMDLYRNSFLSNFDSEGYKYSIIEEYDIPVENGSGYYMQLSVELGNSSIVYYSGLYIKEDQVNQTLCFMYAEEDETDAETFRQIIKSFRFTD